MRNELRKTLVAIAVAFVLVGAVIFLTGAVNDINAHFPGGITLSGNAHLYTDSGAQLMRDGVPVIGAGGGTVGTMINTDSLTTGDLIASKDGTTTNMTKATAANATNLIGQVVSSASRPQFAGVYAGQFRQPQTALTHAGDTTADFDAVNYNTMTVTGNVVLVSANLAAARTFGLRLLGCSTNSLITWPAGWHAVGAPLATNLPASKIVWVSAVATSGADSGVDCATAVEP